MGWASPPTLHEQLVRRGEPVIRVYRLPPPLELVPHPPFGGGTDVVFVNVDWFPALEATTCDEAASFFRRRYSRFDPKARYLVLGDRTELVFTIDPEVTDG